MICEHCGREKNGREHWPQGGYCVLAPLDAPDQTGRWIPNGSQEHPDGRLMADGTRSRTTPPPKDANRPCFICGESMADGHGCLRVYAEAKNKALVIESRKERGYELVEWITDGYSGGDVAYFRRPGTAHSELPAWMKLAYTESVERGATWACLVPCYPDRKWWADWVEGKASEVRLHTRNLLPSGRVHFEREDGTANRAGFPSAVVIYRPTLAMKRSNDSTETGNA